MRFLILYLAGVNVLAYAVYWLDKRRAQRGRPRVRERELLLWAAAGGSVGALVAMRRHRHKTSKRSFRLALYAIAAAQLAAAILLLRLR